MFDGNVELSGYTEDYMWVKISILFGQISPLLSELHQPMNVKALLPLPALWCAGETCPTSDEQWFNKLPFPPADWLSLCETMLYFLQFISRPSVCDNMPVSSEKRELYAFFFFFSSEDEGRTNSGISKQGAHLAKNRYNGIGRNSYCRCDMPKCTTRF